MLCVEHQAMDAATLVDVRITCAYQNDRDGLQTFSMPVMLMPICASCCACCDQQACVACGAYICSACVEAHACCCNRCGALSAFSCNLCGLPLCAECAPDHKCAGGHVDAYSAASDGEPEGEPVGETGDTTWRPRLRELTYTALRELWAPRGTPMALLKDDMWVQVACAPGLCPPRRQAGSCRSFGEEINDFTLLCEALAWEFPKGVAIVHLDKMKTIVCGPGRGANAAHVTSALSWLRSTREQTFGIALRSVRDRLQGAFLDVLFHPRLDGNETTKRRRAVLKAVSELAAAP